MRVRTECNVFAVCNTRYQYIKRPIIAHIVEYVSGKSISAERQTGVCNQINTMACKIYTLSLGALIVQG